MIFSKKKESRKFDRYYPKENAYIVFTPNFSKRGPIVNISKGGLACLYFIDKNIKDKQIDRCASIRCGTFSMGEIPFQIISDSIVSDSEHGGQRIIRKRSILFCELDITQEKQIDYFLKNHTKWSITNYRRRTAERFSLP